MTQHDWVETLKQRNQIVRQVQMASDAVYALSGRWDLHLKDLCDVYPNSVEVANLRELEKKLADFDKANK